MVVALALGVLASAAMRASGQDIAAGHAAEPDDRVLTKSVVVNARVHDVWRAWTTEKGIASFFFKSDSRIKLEIGGPYELYMGMTEPDESGLRGSEGCKVLSFVPREMLAFEWNFPPAVMALRKAHARTQVVLRFKAIDGERTEVRFSQLGWGKGEDWDKGYAYFDRAWPMVLGQMKKVLEEAAPSVIFEDASESALADLWKTRRNGWRVNDVDVELVYGPGQLQAFETTVPVGMKKVWSLLATEDGLRTLGAAEPKVELRPGGAYGFWKEAGNRVLAFVPGEMLSTSGSAPPEFPEVRKGGTWGCYFFEPAGENETRIRLVVLGWRPGEDEWDRAFEYFVHNNAIWMGMVRRALGAPAGDGVERVTFEVMANPADAWEAFATGKGLRAWMAPHAEIDARAGGTMRVNYSAAGTLGDAGTIEHEILAAEPERRIEMRVTKSPEGFPFAEEIKPMRTLIRFEPTGEGRTRVHFECSGIGSDENSQKMRTFFRRGNAVTARRLQDYLARKR